MQKKKVEKISEQIYIALELGGVLRYHSYVSQNNTKFINPLKDFWDRLGPPKMVDGRIMGTMDNRWDFFFT